MPRPLLAFLAFAAAFAPGVSAQTSAIAPKFLFDPKSPNAASLLKSDGSAQATPALDKDGIVVTIQPGPSSYPGVSVAPEGRVPWNLAPWGHVEAKITNLGTTDVSVAMRVDNKPDGNSGNTEGVRLKPNESKVLKVIFGYSYGYKPGFALNPESVVQLLFFSSGKTDAVRVFRIDDIQANGAAGEKPPFDPNTARAKPENGVIFSGATKLDAAKQVAAKNGAKAEIAPDGALKVEFAGAKDESVVLQPAVGSWQLTDCTEVRVKVKNAGSSPVTPKARVESKQGPTDTATAAAPIAPNAEGEIVVPFIPSVSAVFPTDPKQEIVSTGSYSERNWEPKKGTGTKFASGWVKGVTVLSDGSPGAKSLLVTSIVGAAPVAELPAWAGQKPPVDGEWTKTLDENFDGGQLDYKTWSIYTHNYWDKRTHFSKDNVIVKDGKLTLHYEKKTGFQNDNPNDTKTVGKTDYACGFADTFGKWTQRYGYFESRLKPPKAPGLWPAFWTMPDRGSTVKWRSSTRNGGMETDIWEFLSGWGPFRYNIAQHWDDYGPEHKGVGSSCIYAPLDKEGFVTVGYLWTPGSCVFYAQGKEVGRWESPRVCSVQSHLMYTLVSGGWDNEPLDAAKLPDDLVVDYVRAWQRKDLATAEDGPKPNKGLPSERDDIPANPQ
jgi:beta-glucanase (GH16 family)